MAHTTKVNGCASGNSALEYVCACMRVCVRVCKYMPWLKLISHFFNNGLTVASCLGNWTFKAIFYPLKLVGFFFGGGCFFFSENLLREFAF